MFICMVDGDGSGSQEREKSNGKDEREMTAKYAFKQSIPIMAGYIVLGMGFGVLLEAKGYGVLWAIAMSVFIYAGSMQYVAIDLITGGAPVIATALMTLMVNARHLFYGISMLDKYKDTGKYKPYLILALTDETYSLVCSGEIPDGVDKNKYYFLVSLFDQIYWVLGSVAGSVLGSVLNFNTTGIDFSMTALFLVVFVEQWKSTKDHKSAITGVVASVVCLLIFGAGNFVIPAMISITVILLLMKKGRKSSDDVTDDCAECGSEKMMQTGKDKREEISHV